MKYFKDKKGQIFSYDNEQMLLAGIKNKTNKMSELSSEEIEAILNPEKTEEQLTAEWKAERKSKLDNATVTISTGKVFDADEKSITRMNESKEAVRDAVEVGLIQSLDEFPLSWVLHGNDTGVLTPITYIELVEACALANQNRAKLWGRA